jgi:hypothetical protein
MRTLIISAILVLALTHVGPTLAEDANHIIPGCRTVTDEQSFKDLAEARECLGIIEGMRVGAILQSHVRDRRVSWLVRGNVQQAMSQRDN